MLVGLVCLEPLVKVTGGIGTYTRELASALSADGHTVYIFTKDKCIDRSFESESRIFVPIDAKLQIQNLVSVQLKDSLMVYGAVKKLMDQGVDFDFIECPDYCAPGYFLVSEKLAGRKLPPIFIRLHSPCFLIADSNNQSRYDLQTLQLFAAERFSIRHASAVLCGNEAIKNRVSSYFTPKELFDVVFQKADHPTFKPRRSLVKHGTVSSNQPVRIGLVGRLEFLKGWDLIFRANNIPWENVEFYLFGKDTDTFGGHKMSDVIAQLIPPERRQQVHFFGLLTQEELWNHFDQCDAFIFPSRFENHPNALLEVLPLNKPVAVSLNGGMPELVHDYSSSMVFDPFKYFDWDQFLSLSDSKTPYVADESWYSEYLSATQALSNLGTEPKTGLSEALVSIVIPVGPKQDHLKAAIDSVLTDTFVCEVILALDGVELEKSEEFKFENAIRVIEFPKMGPARLRILASKIAAGNVVHFLDSDDMLHTKTWHQAWAQLANQNKPLIVTALMQAFGKENYTWIPTPMSRTTIKPTNSSHPAWATNLPGVECLSGLDMPDIEHDEDWLVLIWAAFNDIPMATISEVGYFYRKWGESRSTDKALFRFESTYIRQAFYAKMLNEFGADQNTLKELIFFESDTIGSRRFSKGITIVHFVLFSLFGSSKIWPILLLIGRKVLRV